MLDVEALRPGTCDTVLYVYCHAHSVIHSATSVTFPRWLLWLSPTPLCLELSSFVLRLCCVVAKHVVLHVGCYKTGHMFVFLSDYDSSLSLELQHLQTTWSSIILGPLLVLPWHHLPLLSSPFSRLLWLLLVL